MGCHQGDAGRSPITASLLKWQGMLIWPRRSLDNREDYGEDRYVIIGLVKNRLLFVAYTMRGKVIRIISARGAEPHERRQYHEENG